MSWNDMQTHEDEPVLMLMLKQNKLDVQLHPQLEHNNPETHKLHWHQQRQFKFIEETGTYQVIEDNSTKRIGNTVPEKA